MSDPHLPVFQGAFGALAGGPRPLGVILSLMGAPEDADQFLLERLRAAEQNDPAFNLMRTSLIRFDCERDADWVGETSPNTPERRARVYQLLALSESLRAFCDEFMGFLPAEDRLIVIAKEHAPWYSAERRQAHCFYWTAYAEYLREVRNWNPNSVERLNHSTTAVVERLADPERPEAYQSKGLVVGYVQSGKTANFTGVIAKAADAGYRLIIVLSGTMDVLRDQTQRRIDKELIGKELITRGLDSEEHDYSEDDDWDRFVEHGSLPSELGFFDWQRLTGPGRDYRRLEHGIDALELERRDAGKPFFDSSNLHFAKARLLVVKKNSAVLERVAGDLRRIRTRLEHVPALIIDDESDQASVDTRRPDVRDDQDRKKINGHIVDLLAALPRAQYVGYTATPFANVFIDPEDSEDLFPKDFIVSLERPMGYMGARDFHDFDPVPDGVPSNEEAFIRSVAGEDDAPENLPKAIDSYIVSGAIKLYRAAHGADVDTRHHTMLVHTSHRVGVHSSLAGLIEDLLNRAGYNAGKGMDRLRSVFEDFRAISAERATDRPFPATFDELKPHLGECLNRLRAGDRRVLVVNGQRGGDSPDFDRQSVWKIVVGGAKLSRGFTIEGLTISYYRRLANQADSLMQMGRWFGFRPGYQDLVRLFIGRSERVGRRRHPTRDLYKEFEQIVLDEEEFRQELDLYANQPDGHRITPMQVPPLVSSRVLRPAARNKMYNAEIKSENFGGRSVQPTLAPTADRDVKYNEDLFRDLLNESGPAELSLQMDAIGFDAMVGEASHSTVVDALASYRWSRSGVFVRELGFLRGEAGDPGIDRWILMAPQLKRRWRQWNDAFTVIKRYRDPDTGRFNVYTEPNHVTIAKYLAGLSLARTTNESLDQLKAPKTAVLLFYPTVNNEFPDEPPTMGFALSLPRNDIPIRIQFGVKNSALEDQAIVAVE